MNIRTLRACATLILCLVGIGTAEAGVPFSGTVFYTKYSSPPSLKKMDLLYDGTTNFYISNITQVLTLGAADGLAVAADGDLLIGQCGQSAVTKVNPYTGTAMSYPSGGGSCHMSLDIGRAKVWAGFNYNGDTRLSEVPLNPFTNGTPHTITGDDTAVGSLAWDKAGNVYYVVSNPAGHGSFGTINLTTFVTHRLLSNLDAAHGMAYDPFSNSLILFGDRHITQVAANPATGTIVGDLDFGGRVSEFDQGSVDGRGHIFVADNGGIFAFIDYSSTGVLNMTNNFVYAGFLENYLDDMAPVSLAGNGDLADLALSYAVSPNPAHVRSNVTLTITVTNAGPTNATSVNFAAPLPANAQFVSVTAPAGLTCSNSAGTVYCSGTFARNTQGQIVITVIPLTGPVTIRASITSAETDPYFYNNLLNIAFDAPPACVAAPSGLVSLWTLDGHALDSVSTNHGIVTNGATFLSGKVGGSLFANGVVQGVVIPDGPSVKPASLSVGGWFNFSVTDGTRTLLAKSYGCCYDDSYTIWLQGGVVNAYVYTTAGAATVLTGPVPQAGTWHHYMLTFDDATKTETLYIDGNPVSTATTTSPIAYDTHALTLGIDTQFGGLDIGLAGSMDDVALFNRALSAWEIRRLIFADSEGICLSGINITPSSLPEGTTNAPYSVQLTAVHASPDYNFSVASGSLPPGLTLSSAGALAGTPTVLGTYPVNVAVVDGLGLQATQAFTIRIVPCDVRPLGLLAWWRGESNALDETGSHNGTAQGDVSYPTGRVGRAFALTGSSYVDAGAWAPNLQWSVEAWVTVSNWVGGRRTAVGTMSECRDWGIVSYDAVLGGQYRPPGGCSAFLSSGIYPALGAWYHLVETCDGTNAYVYVNGVLKNSAAVDRAVGPSANGVRIGGAVCCGEFWQGMVDEPAIYNRALTASEVNAIYSAGTVGKCRGGVPPTIASVLTNITVGMGQTVSFSVNAGGAGPLTYQWYQNGVPVPRGTNATLTITNATPPDIGYYSVYVGNAAGSVTIPPGSLSLADLSMFAGVVINGIVGKNYRVDYSNDLNTWTPLTTINLPNTPYVYIDFSSPSYPKRFYRAVLLP